MKGLQATTEKIMEVSRSSQVDWRIYYMNLVQQIFHEYWLGPFQMLV